MIADNRGDKKKLWRTFSAVTGSRNKSDVNSPHTAETFVKFFADKVAIGGGSYWAGRAAARPLFGLRVPQLCLARPLLAT